MAAGSDEARRRVNGHPGRPAKQAPEARHLRIPPTALEQLSVALNWIDMSSRGRLSRVVINSAMHHCRVRGTSPSILIAAAIQFLVSDCDRQEDKLNRYWTLVNQVSARDRARYLNLEEEELL